MCISEREMTGQRLPMRELFARHENNNLDDLSLRQYEGSLRRQGRPMKAGAQGRKPICMSPVSFIDFSPAVSQSPVALRIG